MINMSRELKHSYVIISCEGNAEKEIIELLSDAGHLIIPKDNIIDITTVRDSKKIVSEYLGFDYARDVMIVRVLDSPRERFDLGKLYDNRVEVVSVYTQPEIEILVIIAEGKYGEFSGKYKSKMKPSEYCVQYLGYANVKHKGFFCGYFSDVSVLVKCICEYKRVRPKKKRELSLFELLDC